MTPPRNSNRIRRDCFHYWRRETPFGWEMVCRCGCDTPFYAATESWEAEHLIPRAQGGSDDPPNVRPLLTRCHKLKTPRDLKAIAKDKRVSDQTYGVRRSTRPMPGSKRSGWKHRMDGGWERR